MGWLGVGVIVGGLVTLGGMSVTLGGMWLEQTMPAAPAAPIAIAIVVSLGVVGLLIAKAVELSSLWLESGDRHLGWLSVGVIVGWLFTLGGMWRGQTMPAALAAPIEIVVQLGVVGLLIAEAFALSFLLLESGDRRSGWLSVGAIVGMLVTLGVVSVTLGVMRLR